MLYFADFEFDERAGELRRNGETRRLEPQPARVLGVLLERAGEVVTRTELQQRVWSGDTFVDFDRGLNYCIAQIRDVLGDSASEPRFIETLPRRGYRFMTLPSPRPVPQIPQAKNIPPLVVVAAIAVVVLLIAGVSMVVVPRDVAKTKPDIRVRLAVVPFDNETGVADYDRLAQTLTDATVARLAADSTHLAVVGNALALRAPRSQRDLKAIGSSLNVGHVVLGQVQQIDGHLRITTHLIRTGDQAHLWAQRFEPSASDTEHLDREVAEAVAGAIAKRLLGS